MRIPHGVFLFRVGEDPFNRFPTHAVGFLAFGSVAEILCLLHVICPKVSQDYLLAAPALRALG